MTNNQEAPVDESAETTNDAPPAPTGYVETPFAAVAQADGGALRLTGGVYEDADIDRLDDAIRRTSDGLSTDLVIDLSDVYAGHDESGVRLAEWDDHPNARGHELVAERLQRELLDSGALSRR